jgi:hypothetical protein
VLRAALAWSLDEPGCREVLVEREGFTQAPVAHHTEACRVNMGVFPLLMPAEPVPCRGLLVLGDPVHDEAVSFDEGVEPIEERDGGPMTVLAAKEGPSLAGHEVGRENLFGSPERARWCR